jgi:hypothetical protein
MKVQKLSYCGACKRIVTCDEFEHDINLGYLPGKNCPIPDVPKIKMLAPNEGLTGKSVPYLDPQECVEFVMKLWEDK